jgi:hypothetical protein
MQVKCTSCGAQQNVDEAKNCDFCGNPIELEIAKNNYQTFLKGESGNLMSMAETAIEATNWDEALQFFNQVLTKDISNSDAWLGKGIAIVYTSKIGDLKITEAIAYWKNALKHATKSEAMGKRVAKEINEVVNKFYPTIENHFIKFKDLENSYDELVSKFVILEKAQDYATQLDSSNITLFETGYALCRRVIDIPKKYAMADSTSAMAGVIIGGLQGNKYKQQDAIKQSQNARERKREIEAAALVVNNLASKYVQIIKKINPNHIIVESLENYTVEKDLNINESKIKQYNKFDRFVYSLISAIIFGGATMVIFGNQEGSRDINKFLFLFGGTLGYLLMNKYYSQIKK